MLRPCDHAWAHDPEPSDSIIGREPLEGHHVARNKASSAAESSPAVNSQALLPNADLKEFVYDLPRRWMPVLELEIIVSNAIVHEGGSLVVIRLIKADHCGDPLHAELAHVVSRGVEDCVVLRLLVFVNRPPECHEFRADLVQIPALGIAPELIGLDVERIQVKPPQLGPLLKPAEALQEWQLGIGCLEHGIPKRQERVRLHASKGVKGLLSAQPLDNDQESSKQEGSVGHGNWVVIDMINHHAIVILVVFHQLPQGTTESVHDSQVYWAKVATERFVHVVQLCCEETNLRPCTLLPVSLVLEAGEA
mmetsp:Transcript_21116/g.33106  ORF Transcript_21116/g.33106 Transcript_21116/m.33106 type:complete len:307 (-) Transcript_21116:730-1650(-)